MSTTRKRALVVESEAENSRESKDKDKKSVPSCRPPKPAAKRRKTTEVSDTGKGQAGDVKVPSKGKRQAWTKAASDAFFEGLLQHGKDFHKILKYMQSKQKKLNDSTIGNLTKDQVRFFYYRSWHKVEPLLNFPADSRKSKGSNITTPQSVFSESNDDSVSDEQPKETSGDTEKSAINQQQGDTENKGEPDSYLDSSIEEMEPGSPPVVAGKGSQEQDVKCSPSPGDRAAAEKSSREVVQATPITVPTDKGDTNIDTGIEPRSIPASKQPNASDSEGKVKDTVLVSGTRQSLDLVALICYHKLRNKNLGDHNIGKRLSELVFQGVTTVPSRVKGKRKAQIRIPSNCGAFRGPPRKTVPDEQTESTVELCPTTEANTTEGGCHDDPAAPVGQVVVELRPLSSSTWLHVQGLSFNPRMRLCPVKTDSLSALRDYLTLRWQLDKDHSLKFYSSQALNSSLKPHNTPPTSSHPTPSHKPPPSPLSYPTPPHKPPPSPSPIIVRDAISLPPTPKSNTALSQRECHSVPATPNSRVSDSKTNETNPPTSTKTTISMTQETKDSEAETELDSQAYLSSEQAKLNNKETSLSNDISPPIDAEREPPKAEDLNDGQAERSGTESVDKVSESQAQLLTKSLSEVAPRSGIVDKTSGSESFSECVRGSELKLTSTWKDLAMKSDLSPLQLCYEITKTKETHQSQSPSQSSDRLRALLKLVKFFLKTFPSDSPQKTGWQTPVKRPPLAVHKSPKVIEYMQTLNRHSPHKSPLSKYRRLKTKSPLKHTTPNRVVKRVQLSFQGKESAAMATSTATTVPTASLAPPSSSTHNVLTTLKVGDLTPPIVQVTSPGSIGSFADFQLQSLLPNQTHSQTQSPTSISSNLQPSTEAQQTRKNLAPTSSIKPSSIIANGIRATLGSGVPSNTITTAKAPPPVWLSQSRGMQLTPLEPGVHRIQPRVISATTVQSMQQVAMTTRTQGVPLVPKPTIHGDGGSKVVMPIVSSLKPFTKPKRVKKPPAKPGQPHQLVPRPLPFLRNIKLNADSQNGPSASATSTTQTQTSSSGKTTAALIQNQQLMLQLLQSYMLQQQRTKLAQQPLTNSHTTPTQSVVNSTNLTISSAPTVTTHAASTATRGQLEIDDRELQSTMVDNFLAEGQISEASGSSKMFHTSSDTVNNLLRGLSSVKPNESIHKLSEETADVLPTFAKALGNSLLSPPLNKSPERRKPVGSAVSNTDALTELQAAGGEDQSHKSDEAGDTDTPKPASEDRQLPFLHDVSSTSLTDILGTLTDSNFKQVADNGEIFEHIDFTDMFSQLKDVISPEKLKPGDGEDSQSSIGNLLDYVNGPPEKRTVSTYTAPVDPACRSFLEDNSVDFVQKFRELASTMEGHSSVS